MRKQTSKVTFWAFRVAADCDFCYEKSLSCVLWDVYRVKVVWGKVGVEEKGTTGGQVINDTKEATAASVFISLNVGFRNHRKYVCCAWGIIFSSNPALGMKEEEAYFRQYLRPRVPYNFYMVVNAYSYGVILQHKFAFLLLLNKLGR